MKMILEAYKLLSQTVQDERFSRTEGPQDLTEDQPEEDTSTGVAQPIPLEHPASYEVDERVSFTKPLKNYAHLKLVPRVDKQPIDPSPDVMPLRMPVPLTKAKKTKKLRVKKKPKVISLAAALDPYTATEDPLNSYEFGKYHLKALQKKEVDHVKYGFTAMHNPTSVDNKISNLRNAANVCMSVTIDKR